MPTLRDKVADFLRQLSLNNDRPSESRTPCTSPVSGTFIQRYLSGEVPRSQPEIIHGKSCYELPVEAIAPLSRTVVASYTGPSGGLTQVNQKQKAFTFADQDVDFIDEDSVGSNENLSKGHQACAVDDDSATPASSTASELQEDDIAGIKNWDMPADFAHGIATTLYECHPVTKENAGEPIADAFAVCARENSAILALADGVNWGEKSCLAARCAVHGCMDYLNKALYREGGKIETTLDIFVCLLRSFQAAHNLILQEKGMLTTLCAAVVCQLKNSNKYIICTCNVGDSLAYIYSKQYGVREITLGSHDINSMRDMRDALGALGPVDGQNPELNNLTVSMTVAEPGDIVFLTSDGISDNFDPVVGKFALPKKARKGDSKDTSPCDLPVVEAHQRHELTLLRMEDLINNGVYEGDTACQTAQELCERMIDFAMKLTIAKRRILEDPELYKQEDVGVMGQRVRRQKVGEKLAMVPGKLDHASLVAYLVGMKLLDNSEQNKNSLSLKSKNCHFESTL